MVTLDVLRRVLADGHPALLNTDTLPGLHARLDRPEALAAVQRLKGRDADKPMLVLAASPAAARELTEPLTASQVNLLESCWPGPFTFVLPARAHLPGAVVAAAGTVAVRVPRRTALLTLLVETGPLASTSANRAGAEAAVSLVSAAQTFPDLACWDDGDPAPGGEASALVDLTGPQPRVLRPGPEPLSRA